ncbi:MAG: MurT ligase domain-containing protein [Vampirovibrionales bacterium]|nr:MurT ligase domain-containing protein [Vampirovibrionales bacterium]
MNPRARLACWMGQSAALALKLSGQGAATSLPGKLALAVAPSLLSHLNHLGQDCLRIGVTGTNGKTTTAGLLSALLAAIDPAAGLLHNRLGANMKNGLVTTLLMSEKKLARSQYAVLEVDEASLAGFTRDFPLNTLLVSNLFRDQLDRYGELDTTARLIADGFASVRGGLILNADDPLVASLSLKSSLPSLFFGVESVVFPDSLPHEPDLMRRVPFQTEVTNCPLSGEPLRYHRRFYGHLGHYASANGFSRPMPHVVARQINLHVHASTLLIDIFPCPQQSPSQQLTLNVPLPGLFNAYNLLAAMAALVHTTQFKPLDETILQEALNAFSGVFGRAEARDIHNRSVRVFLIKNPAGASEVIRLVSSDPKAKLVIAINDDYADGRDISWLWDAPFEWFSTIQPPVVVSGRRAADMAVRLKYAGLDEGQLQVEANPKEAILKAIETMAPDETLYVLPTYTALLQLRCWLSGWPVLSAE